MTVLSRKLKIYRAESGLTQPDMAKLLGVTQTQYYNYERTDQDDDGRERGSFPPADKAVYFANRLLVRYDWLYGDSENALSAHDSTCIHSSRD